MLSLRYCLPLIPTRLESIEASKKWARSYIICEQKGPRPRYPRVWKAKPRIGTISKAAKLVDCVKGLSNVKEEVYGALDSFVAWDLEFPLITVKKALRTLEHQEEWKRIIQVSKWMLNKGQGRTMGTYFILLNALAEDERLEEAEELWNKLFMRYLESMPRKFFDKMISIYYKRDMHDKMFEIFADMEELGVQPSVPIVNMIGAVFQHRGMVEKYEKLKAKYPPPEWEFRYIKGKRVRIRAKHYREYESERRGGNKEEASLGGSREVDDDDDDENAEESSDLEETSLSSTEFEDELDNQVGRDDDGGLRNEGSSRSVDEPVSASYQQTMEVDDAG